MPARKIENPSGLLPDIPALFDKLNVGRGEKEEISQNYGKRRGSTSIPISKFGNLTDQANYRKIAERRNGKGKWRHQPQTHMHVGLGLPWQELMQSKYVQEPTGAVSSSRNTRSLAGTFQRIGGSQWQIANFSRMNIAASKVCVNSKLRQFCRGCKK